jgi:4-hydroxythreonine-4-phosphate dehydrogenase
VLLVGDEGVLRAAARGRGVDGARLLRVHRPEEGWSVPRGRIAIWQPTVALAAKDRRPGKPTARSGAAQLEWVDEACDVVAKGRADALVTGPVSKEAIVRSRARGSQGFLGHTEHLQRRLRSREVFMAFWSPSLVTSLVTTHLPLARVPGAITPAGVSGATYWLAWLLSRSKKGAPRVAVAALNPHAGEGGLFGRQDIDVSAPTIAQAVADGLDVVGPVPGDTIFVKLRAGQYDAAVAMYHDQGHIPVKLLGFQVDPATGRWQELSGVNITLGLPIIRTSVDHGTAFDIAGKGIANEHSLIEAIDYAERLAAGVSASRS